ncbi:MAG: glycosyltransferase family 2 protein [Actinomycetota bacterium]|nr:glycosyltransferase family 2 protein [Actinomycetota bacterium]
MAKERRVSIIVLTHNQLDYTKACFDAIFETTAGFELVVVDNASTDGTTDYLRELDRERRNIRVIYNTRNAGFARGCNQGVSVAKYELLCLLNNDTVPHAGWLDAMRKVMDKDAGIVGARLLFPDMTLQHAGIAFRLENVGGRTLVRPSHRYYRQPADLPEANVLEDVVGVTGACLLTSKRVWHEMGGLDEGYILANYEDVDFNLKVLQAGYRIIYQPDAVLIHYQNTTVNSKAGQADDPAQYLLQNLVRLNAKWGSLIRPALEAAQETPS